MDSDSKLRDATESDSAPAWRGRFADPGYTDSFVAGGSAAPQNVEPDSAGSRTGRTPVLAAVEFVTAIFGVVQTVGAPAEWASRLPHVTHVEVAGMSILGVSAVVAGRDLIRPVGVVAARLFEKFARMAR